MKTTHPWPAKATVMVAACLFAAGVVWTVPCHAQTEPKIEISQEKLAAVTKPTTPRPPAPQNSAAAETAKKEPPSRQETATAQKQVQDALLKPTFSYDPKLMVDPFVSFIKPAVTMPLEFPAEQGKLPPKPERPLTPLQKMSLGEIEKGLTAISWGSLGRRAIIQDSAGRGYIVSVGTPAAGRNGIVLRIYADRLVIRQEVWNSTLERMVYQDKVVKLKKNQGS